MSFKPLFKRSIVAVERVGDVHVREPSAGAAIQLAQLAKRQQAGEPVEMDLLRLILRAGVLTPEGAPMFKGEDDPLEAWPIGEATAIAAYVQGMLSVVDKKEADSPNSVASPSAG